MKYKSTLSLLFLICQICYLHAGNGDITSIDVHQDVDMTWYGNYDQVGTFPDGTTDYRQVLMHYTMGCSSNQCSDWDYTTRIMIMNNTGMIDSTITELDTISTMPLVVDTLWNVYDVLEPYMLGEVITPYGPYMANSNFGFSPNWEHTHTFDVTDFVHLLKDETIIRAFYDGWSDGFSVSLTFEFIEGTPSRPVNSVRNYYTGSLGYSNFTEVENEKIPEKEYTFPTGTESVKLRVNKSGHGADDNAGCAEFCQKYYQILANGQNVSGNVYVMRNDCDESHTWPQGGTWIFSREGWCPGERSSMNEFELGDHMDLDMSNTLNVDFQTVNWAGSQPKYYFDAQLISYGAYHATNDIQIHDILQPSTKDDYKRYNPTCDNPIVKVKNMGSAPVNSIKFYYGLNHNFCEYTWTGGNIAPSEYAEISLPALNWADPNPDNPYFTVIAIDVNGTTDEYDFDNNMTIPVEMPALYTDGLKLEFRTNNRPTENSYTIKDLQGNIVAERIQGSLAATTTYTDDLDLSPGCYILSFKDTGYPGFGAGDGLSFWYSSQCCNVTSGYIQLKNGNGNVIKQFIPDFGGELYHPFIIGESYGSASGECAVTDVKDISTLENSINVFPNPSKGIFNINIEDLEIKDAIEFSVYDISGKQILDKNTSDSNFKLDLSKQSKGIYYLRMNIQGQFLTKELILVK